MLKHELSLAWIQSVFDDPDLHVCFHHAKFDLKMFGFEGIDIFNIKAHCHCTLILAKMFNGMMPAYDLRWLGISFFDRDPGGKDEITEWLKSQNRGRALKERGGRKLKFSDAPRNMVKRRALWDVETTLLLFHFFYPRVQQTCPNLYETERQLMFVVIDMENAGLEVDISMAERLAAECNAGTKRLQRMLDRIIGPLTIRWATCTRKGCKKRNKKIKNPVCTDRDMPDKCPCCGGAITICEEVVNSFNANSLIHKTVAWHQLSIPLKYRTKPKKGKKGGHASGGGNWSFDEYAMIRYSTKPIAWIIRQSGEESWTLDQFIGAVRQAKNEHSLRQRDLVPALILKITELKKLVSTYYRKLIYDCAEIDYRPDGRKVGTLHAKFNQSEAMTGRFCLSKGTKVQVPGGTKPIEEIVPGDWVYCYDRRKNLALKKVTWSGKTGHKKVVRVSWQGGKHSRGTSSDNKGHIDLTPEHRVRLVSGKYIEAKNLRPGDRVLSLHRHTGKNGYNFIQVTNRGQYKESRFVFQEVNGWLPEHVHHKNECCIEDQPSNLEGKQASLHHSEHLKNQWVDPIKRRRLEIGLSRNKATGERHGKWRAVSKEEIVWALRQNSWLMKRSARWLGVCDKLMQDRVKRFGINVQSHRKDKWRWDNFNHRVVGVVPINKAVDVYDLEVEGEHNFIANEICVHNSSSEPNLQNLPRILGPRLCFITRRGRRNWHFDYEQVEMKFFVHFARDSSMAKAIEADIHLYVASQIYGIPMDKITKEQRKRAKTINFGIIYGSGARKNAETLTKHGLITTVPESRRLVAAYHRRFPSVRRATNALKIELGRKGFLTNPFERRYHIPQRYAYRGLNYMCQGTSADLMKASMVKVWKWLRSNNLKTRLLLQVHDELAFEIPRAEEAFVPAKIKQLMEDRTSFFIPITVDAEIAPRRWAKKVKPEKLGLKLAA